MKKTILVCDDDEGIVEVIKIVLEEKGYNVDSSNDCDELVAKAEKIQPSLILLDLWMPGLGGEQITRDLKKNKKTKNIPVIIISASKDSEIVAKNVGAVTCLPKPFDIEVLEDIVKEYIQ